MFCLLLVGTGVTAYAGSGVQVTDANNQTKVYEDVIQTLTINGEKKDLMRSLHLALQIHSQENACA